MADVTITAAEVLPTSTTGVESGIAGATLTAGMPVYKDSTDGNSLKPCDADASASAQCVGIMLCGAADGQRCIYAKTGDIDPGFTAVAGEAYAVSTTAGGIAPVSDITTAGDFICILGIATSASNLRLNIFSTTVARAS